jgi:hypothetical protein
MGSKAGQQSCRPHLCRRPLLRHAESQALQLQADDGLFAAKLSSPDTISFSVEALDWLEAVSKCWPSEKCCTNSSTPPHVKLEHITQIACCILHAGPSTVKDSHELCFRWSC